MDEIWNHDEELVFGVVYDPHFSDVTPRSRKDDYVQALFDKMSFVARDLEQAGGKFLIFPGDIFHKTTVSTKYLNRFIRFITSLPFPVYGICGNHDVYAANPDFVNRTALGILFASRVIRKLEHLLVVSTGTLDAEGKEVTPGFTTYFRGFDFEPALEVKRHAHETMEEAYRIKEGIEEGEEWDGAERATWNVGVAHGFITKAQAHYRTKDYVSVPSFGENGYHALFLGHDHVPYPTEQMNGVIVCRGGNLSRGTKHRYQRVREVQYHRVTVGPARFNVEERKIPCAPADEIYSEAQIEREDLNLQLKKFVSRLQETKEGARNDDDIFTIIEGMPVQDRTRDLCFKYLGEHGVVRKSR